MAISELITVIRDLEKLMEELHDEEDALKVYVLTKKYRRLLHNTSGEEQ